MAGTALALPAPALAQFTPPPSPPPIRETIDGNGVDLGRGTVVSRAHSVSIGGPGNLGLGWSREITSSGGARDSSNGWIVSGNGVTVAVGGGSETFTLTGGNYVSVEKTGSTLTNGVGGFVYTTAGGTRYTFEIPADDSTFGAQQQISTITQPTGEVQTYHYQVVDGVCFYKPADHCVSQYSVSRLSSITSSNGYQLHFDYFRPSDPINQTMTTDWYRLAKVTALTCRSIAARMCRSLAAIRRPGRA